MTRIEQLDQDARAKGFTVRTYSPGDGVTRYRFFRLADVDDARQDYFGPKNGTHTALGLKEARIFVEMAR